ncbi:MFS transporter [Sandaracinobacteroides hominis]|uniref:MFS transporter n=1 Tax=Sandaracinobacteroides hominis TaxID=2780086 RepID=UPI0018F5AA37|nr:MFS transporter [Sandaracinobacteroides hominis]
MRVGLRQLLAWCSAGLPIAALGLPLVVYLPPYYAGTLGLPLATVGFIFAFVRIVDIPFDPLIGALMDNSRSRWGQFRPWMVAGAGVLMLGAWLIFTASPGVSATATFLSLLLLYLGYSFVSLSQVSWGSRLSPDYGERARIFGYWTAFNVFGTLVVLFIPPIAGTLMPEAGPNAGVHAMGWFIIALIPLTVLACATLVPEGEAPGEPHGFNFRQVSSAITDRRMLILLGTDLFLSIAPGITGALFLFFFSAARGIPQHIASILLLCYFIAGLVAAPFWIRLARSWGKHRAVSLAAFWAGAAIFLVLLVPRDNILLFGIAMAFSGIPYAAPNFLLRAMMADLNDAQRLDRMEAGLPPTDHTGLNFAVLTATQKLGFAIPVGLTYPLLALIGFNATPGAANSQAAITGLEILFVAPSMLLTSIAAWLAWKWPITAEVYTAIRARLVAAEQR